MKLYVVAAFAALFLGSFAATAVFSEDPVPPARIVFADVRKVFDGYRKKKDVEDQIKVKADAVGAQFKQRAAQIDKAIDDLNTLNEGSEDRLARERQIRLERFTLDDDRKTEREKLMREQRRKELLIYREISLEAERLRAERGLAAVVLHLPLDADLENAPDLSLFMGTRTVLCRDEALDVTKDLVQRLNASLPPPK